MTGHAPREFDIVVHGASGFVGRLVAGHLARYAPAGVRIALSGRSAEKVAAVRATLPGAADWPIVVADAADAAALRALAARTRVVATTVGPYARHGVPLVEACATAGTDSVDLTGEVVFVRECIDRFHGAARTSGARIVNACGFDSIPSDLGVWITARRAAADGAGTLGATALVMRKAKGGFSGGTIDSLRQQLRMTGADPALARLVADPFGLDPVRRAPSAGGWPLRDADVAWPRRDRSLGEWVGPFVMAPFNTRIVRRSHALLDGGYGPDFHYQEVVGFGTSLASPLRALAMTLGFGALVAGLGFGPTRRLLDRLLPAPGEGPDDEARANGMFALDIVAGTTGGTRYRTRVAAQGDPGYAATSLMLGESALALVVNRDRLPDRAGVLTPATAFGDVLVDRLRAAGMTFVTTAIPTTARSG
ncbi:MAG: saccharopine dehydrogenase family protein [Planctomycetota bacterium]